MARLIVAAALFVTKSVLSLVRGPVVTQGDGFAGTLDHQIPGTSSFVLAI